MLGLFSWIGCGIVLGYFMTRLMEGKDPGLAVFTVGVAIVGSVIGGFVAVFFDYGTVAAIGLYPLLFAAGGAVLTLLTYRKAMGV